MNVNIAGTSYECRAVIVDIGKTTIYYGTFTDEIEDKTDIIGTPEITVVSGEISYTVDWLKAQLVATDYAIIKIAEGTATTEDYADIIAQRQAWRAEINQLGG